MKQNGLDTCICMDGWTGDSCNTPENLCKSKPCLNNGICVDTLGDYKCHCPGKFIGE